MWEEKGLSWSFFLLQLITAKRTWNLTWYFQCSDYYNSIPFCESIAKKTQGYTLFLHLTGKGIWVVYKVLKIQSCTNEGWDLAGRVESGKGSLLDVTALSRGQMGDKSLLATSLTEVHSLFDVHPKPCVNHEAFPSVSIYTHPCFSKHLFKKLFPKSHTLGCTCVSVTWALTTES